MGRQGQADKRTSRMTTISLALARSLTRLRRLWIAKMDAWLIQHLQTIKNRLMEGTKESRVSLEETDLVETMMTGDVGVDTMAVAGSVVAVGMAGITAVPDTDRRDGAVDIESRSIYYHQILHPAVDSYIQANRGSSRSSVLAPTMCYVSVRSDHGRVLECSHNFRCNDCTDLKRPKMKRDACLVRQV